MGRHSADRQTPDAPRRGPAIPEERPGEVTYRLPAPPQDHADGRDTAPIAPTAARLGYAELAPERLDAEHTAAATGRSAGGASPGRETIAAARRGPSGNGTAGPSQDSAGPAGAPRRPDRLAVTTALAVLLAIGVTAGGVRLISQRYELTMAPSGSATCDAYTSCVTSAAGDALPTSGPAEEERPDASAAPETPLPGSAATPSAPPATAPSEPADASPEPRPAPTTAGPADATAAPLAAGRATAPTSPRQAGADAGDAGEAPQGRSDTGRAAPDTRAEPDLPAPREETGPAEGAARLPYPDASGPRPGAAPGAGAVTPGVLLRFTVTGAHDTGYRAELVVRATRDLPGWTVTLRVGGRVTALDGAEWRQRGRTLTIRSAEPLAAGEERRIAFEAEGAPWPPTECALAGGECAVTAR